jgi:hypothetical protein
MRLKRTVLAAVAAAFVLFQSDLAMAQQPTLADRETARSLMDEGDRKRDGGDMKGALKNYEAADAIMHVPTTGLEVARTQVALGQLLEARETLARVIRHQPKPGEPGAFTTARKAADALNNDLAARIPSIQIALVNADPGATAQASVDGEAIPPAAISVARKVNPGAHTVLVRTASYEKKQEITVAERETKTVTFDLKEKASAPDPAPAAPAAEPAGSASSAPRVMMFGGFGLAAVGLGVGAVTGFISLSKTGDLKDRCPNNSCPPGTQDEIDSAKGLGNLSTVAFIAGGVGVGVGVLGLLLSSGDKRESSASGRLEAARVRVATAPLRPLIGPTYVGVGGAF